MRKSRSFIMGLVLGITIGAAGIAFAAGEQITALLANDISFKIDNKYISVPEDQTPILYENRNYVPARFLLEEVGAKVDWDEATKTVIVTSPEPVIEEKIVYIEVEKDDKEDEDNKDDEKKDNHVYEELPLTIYKNDVDLNLKRISRTNDYTNIEVMIYKDKNDRVMIEYLGAKLIVDGKEYVTRNTNNSLWDNRLIDMIEMDIEKIDGNFVFPPIPEDAKNIKLEVDIKKYDVFGTETDKWTCTYYIKHSKSR